MSGYELSEGIYKAGDFTQEELWKAFRNVLMREGEVNILEI